MSLEKEEVAVIDHFLRRKRRNGTSDSLKENTTYSKDGSYYAIRHGWHGSRHLAVVSVNAEEIYRGMNSARIDGPGAKMSISRRGSTPRVGGCHGMKGERTLSWLRARRGEVYEEYIHLSG